MSALVVAAVVLGVCGAGAVEPVASGVATSNPRVSGRGDPEPSGGAVAVTPLPPRGAVGRWIGTVMMGRALRLNNPYRLSTPLGKTAESVSVTAPYLDLALGWTRGPVGGLQHGSTVGFSSALTGVSQHVVTPAYLALWRPGPRWHARGRLGVPVVLNPDVTTGIETAIAAAWYARAGLGLTAELSGSLFFGAATHERERTAIPLVGLSLGGVVDYEVWR
ncbi:MAG: hypothetical protein JW751_22395 [Polyangiaceae bacterium]|nr:hypothetical protein [Polyangiaceae bacterium]